MNEIICVGRGEINEINAAEKKKGLRWGKLRWLRGRKGLRGTLISFVSSGGVVTRGHMMINVFVCMVTLLLIDI
jgi:hypothetical protein